MCSVLSVYLNLFPVLFDIVHIQYTKVGPKLILYSIISISFGWVFHFHNDFCSLSLDKNNWQ
jgi:hypothetical protein